METVNEPTYLGDRSSAVGECEAAVTATATGEVCFWECNELLFGRSIKKTIRG